MNQKELLNKITSYWKENNIFQKTLDQRSDIFKSSTYDGPPFASGTPHFGHGLASSMKDTILRYKTMKGYKVNRERGWDCHGLPVEKAVEKFLGIDGKKDIEQKIGIEKFIEECRTYVSSTSDEWRIFVDSIGRRADMDHAYYTMDLDFMESVLWSFKNMYDQNLVYKGFKVQWYCPSCATSLSNSEVNEGYQDRQDPAITIKFKVNQNQSFDFESTHDGFIEVVDCVLKKDNKFFMLYHKKGQKYVFPGGKIDKGDNLEKTVKKELKEEIGIDVTKIDHLGSFKEIMPYGLFNLNIIDIEYNGEPQNLEPEKHTHTIWAEIIESDNSLGFAVKIDETIIDDEYEITHQFYDLYIYHHKIAQNISSLQGSGNANVNILAWTTTPWTLPGNSFLAVGKHIEYAMVFDKNSKEYYVLAKALLKQYYKSPDEYFMVNIFKGEHVLGLSYEPILPYIIKALPDNYKDKFCKVIEAEFVSTEDGTGIVHIAPSFGMEDFDAVAAFLPREDAKNWLFLPVNEYGEFTDQVPEYQGIRVYDTNKDIITRLKSEGKLILQKSYSHSYPHCRRCDTPLISKALTSWFIKEPELTKTTVKNAENIGFVPETIKNRFSDVLSSAPDWNLARNRYRGSPIPVWENEKNLEDKIVIGTLDELYIHTLTGSKNITRNIFIRHGRSDYNEKKLCDSLGKPLLSEQGIKQSKELVKKLSKYNKDKNNLVFVISPLQRAFLTIEPTLVELYGKENIEKIKNNYYKQIEHYQKIWNDKKIIEYIHDKKNQTIFDIGNNIFIDYRITDHVSPDIQDKFCDCSTLNRYNREKPIAGEGENVAQMLQRTESCVKDWNKEYPTKTILYVAHNDTMAMCRNTFVQKDYHLHRKNLLLENAEFGVHYWDNTYNKQVDLHKPYVDNYWFKIGGNVYKRILEVMDCWFESGAMPFGQANYLGNQTYTTKGAKQFLYPADFIIEGLDQTRGWFRTMHVVGNAVMKQNSFNNVIINGMVLAEDGKKMSKKLKNYPDPQKLFEQYGSDAYRMYLLSSPAVKAEPVRFSEKGVDQVYKDFTSALTNAYKFFETYANVDKFSYNVPTIYAMRHAQSESGEDGKLTTQGESSLHQTDFIEKLLRINADIIYCSQLKRAQETAEIIKKTFNIYREKDIKIIVDERLADNNGILNFYEEIRKQHYGRNILLISHQPQIDTLWKTTYSTSEKLNINNLESVEIPAYTIRNELDKWILAAINETAKEIEQAMDSYQLDVGAKAVLGFIDKLNNRYIRRSRRRFWAAGMDQDKYAAYMTLYNILVYYLQLCAPFAPFISEQLFLQLQNFVDEKNMESIHLTHLPLWSKYYINKTLLDEIAKVRRIISLGLFIRSKNKIAIKQPLQKIELQID
ncbi:MAG: class I tRNA ligase family protein [Candidatus Absconditabacteria bacterium]|nr:class I tRNA ligase family protein [Candidatus Absconditabacteria bacterium]